MTGSVITEFQLPQWMQFCFFSGEPHFSLMTVVALIQLEIVVTSAWVEPTIMEADVSITMLSCSVAPKPITVVVAALMVWPGGLPTHTVVGIGSGMQGAVVWVAIATVSLAMVTPLLLQSFCTGAHTWKPVIVAATEPPSGLLCWPAASPAPATATWPRSRSGSSPLRR